MEQFFIWALRLPNILFQKLCYTVFIAVQDSNGAYCQANDFAPSRLVQMLFDKSASRLFFFLFQFLCGEKFLKGKMQKAIAILAAFNHNTRFSSHCLQKCFSTPVSLIFGNATSTELP